MHREGLRFYSDLIYEPVTLMRDNPEALALVKATGAQLGKNDQVVTPTQALASTRPAP